MTSNLKHFKKIKAFFAKQPTYQLSTHSLSFQVSMKYALSAVLGALAFSLKLALGALPNIELATFLLMACFIFCTLDVAFLVTNVFCTLNLLFLGIADWSIMYFVIFNFYGLVAISLKKVILKWWWVFIIMVMVMGYIFGSLYALETIFLYGPNYALAYWINGLVFDAIHGTGNGFLAFFAFYPFSKVFQILNQRYQFIFNKSAQKYWLNLVQKQPKQDESKPDSSKSTSATELNTI